MSVALRPSSITARRACSICCRRCWAGLCWVTGVGQVGEAINQLDQVTQQNAALVEESAAAAESLRVQADKLAEMVGVFRLSPA